jgi:hypothetical protein
MGEFADSDAAGAAFAGTFAPPSLEKFHSPSADWMRLTRPVDGQAVT